MTLLERIILEIEVKLNTVAGYTVIRSPQHLVTEADVPCILMRLTSNAYSDEQDFNLVNWSANIELSILERTSTSAEARLIASAAKIHEVLFNDRDLSTVADDSVYIYSSSGYTSPDEELDFALAQMNIEVVYRTRLTDLTG